MLDAAINRVAVCRRSSWFALVDKLACRALRERDAAALPRVATPTRHLRSAERTAAQMTAFERRPGAAPAARTAAGRVHGKGHHAPERASEYQRMRILSAMVVATSARGAESVTVSEIAGLARVSRATFYSLFEGREDCLRAMIEEAVALAEARVSAACDPRARWVDRVRVGLQALLELLEEEPPLARVCVAQALVARARQPRLAQALDRLAGILDEGRGARGACGRAPALAAEGTLGGTLGLIYARLITRENPSLLELPESADVPDRAALPRRVRRARRAVPPSARAFPSAAGA